MNRPCDLHSPRGNIHSRENGYYKKTRLIGSTNTNSGIIVDQSLEMSAQDFYSKDWSSTTLASWSGAAPEPATTRKLTSEVPRRRAAETFCCHVNRKLEFPSSSMVYTEEKALLAKEETHYLGSVK